MSDTKRLEADEELRVWVGRCLRLLGSVTGRGDVGPGARAGLMGYVYELGASVHEIAAASELREPEVQRIVDGEVRKRRAEGRPPWPKEAPRFEVPDVDPATRVRRYLRLVEYGATRPDQPVETRDRRIRSVYDEGATVEQLAEASGLPVATVREIVERPVGRAV